LLNQPTSMEIIGDPAYIVMPSGEVWKVDNLPRPNVPRSPARRRQARRSGPSGDDDVLSGSARRPNALFT